MHMRYPRSLRNVEDLILVRLIEIFREPVRSCRKKSQQISPVSHVDGRLEFMCMQIRRLSPREGSTAVAFPPPLAPAKSFSRSGCGRIIPLFSGVMREGL